MPQKLYCAVKRCIGPFDICQKKTSLGFRNDICMWHHAKVFR